MQWPPCIVKYIHYRGTLVLTWVSTAVRFISLIAHSIIPSIHTSIKAAVNRCIFFVHISAQKDHMVLSFYRHLRGVTQKPL